MPEDINLPIPEPSLEAPEQEPLSKWDLVQYSQDLDPTSMSEDDARAFSNFWAQNMDGGMRTLLSPFDSSRRVDMTGDRYFAHDLKLENPIDRVKAIQREYDPTKWPSLASGYEKMLSMSFEQKLEFAKENYGELGGLVGPREALPEAVPMAGAPTEWDPVTQQEIVRTEIAPGNLLDDFLGNVMFRASDAPEDPRQQFGLTEDDEYRLVQRAENEERRKAVYELRKTWEPTLSEAGKDIAHAAAQTGTIDTALFSQLDEMEKERVARYAQLLRRYDDAGVVSEAVQKAFKSVVDPAWDFATYTFDKGRTAFYASPGIFSEKAAKWGGKKLLDLDQIKKDKRLMDLALGDKFKPREGLGEGFIIAAESFGPMAYIAASAATSSPLPLAMLTASYAKETEEMILDATNGKDPEKAAILGGIGGALMTYIERMNNVFPMDDAVKRTFTKNITNATLKFAMERLEGGIKTMTFESGEELLQTWAQTGLKQFGKGELDQDELAGVTSETLEAMAKAGIFFAAMGEAGPTFKTIFNKMDTGRADMVTNKVTNISDKFEAEMPSTELEIEDVVDALPDGVTAEQLAPELEKLGVGDSLETAKTMLAERQGRVQATEAATERVVTAEQETTIKSVAKDFGFDAEVVENLTDSSGRLVEGLYKDGKVLINRIIESDAERVVREEIFHGLRTENRIQVEEWQFFQSEMDKVIAETGVKENYADLDTLGQLEEAVAKKFADYTPKQKGIIQRALDWLKKILKINKAEQTLTADQIFQKIQERETGVQPVATATGEAQSRFRGANPRVLAEAVALGKLSEGETITVAGLKKMFPDADIDFKEVIADAKDEIASATEYEVDRIQQMALFTKSAQRKEVRRAGVEASGRGVEGIEARVEVKKRTTSQKRKQEVKYKRPIPEQNLASVDLKTAVDTNSPQIVIDSTQEAVDAYAKEEGVTSKKIKDAMYKRSLAHVVWESARKLGYDKARTVISHRLSDLRKDSTQVKTANKIVSEIIARLNRVQELAAQKDLNKQLKELFKTATGGRPVSRVLQIDRDITPQTHAQLNIAQELYSKKAEAVTTLSERVDNYLGGVKSVDFNADEGLLIDIEKFMPAIKDPYFSDLTDLQKVQYAKLMLDKWGAMSSMGSEVLASAIEDLEHEINTSKRDQLQAMQEQAKDGRLGLGWVRLGTENKTGKKALIRTSPTFQNIRLRLQELSNFASERGKKAMNNLIDKLKFQESNDTFDRLQKQWADQVGKLLKESYNTLVLDTAVNKLNNKKQEFAKFHPQGDAMSKSQLMQVLVTWWQSDYKSNLRKTGYTQDVIDSIEKVMTPGDMQFIDGLSQIYADMGGELDKISQQIWGTNLTTSDPFYMPVVTDIASEWTGMEMKVSPLMPPVFNQRISNKRKMDIEVGITQLLESRIAQSAHFVAYAKSHILAKTVFTDKKSIESLTRTFGDSIWTGVQHHLTDIYSNGGSDAFRSKWLQRILGVVSLRALSGNLKLPFTQITSIPSYALQYRSWNMVKMLKDSLLDPSSYANSMKEIFNSPQFKSRLKAGGTEFMQQAMRERFGTSSLDAIPWEKPREITKFMSSMLKKLYKYGMFTNKGGDVVPILLIGPSIYMTELRKTGDTEMALTNTWEVIQATQQSYATKDRSALSRRGSTIGKLLSAFTTTPGQFLGFESAAFRTMSAKVQEVGFVEALKTKEFARLADTLFINHIVLPGLFYTVSQVISNFMRGDDWDEDDTNGLIIAMMTGPLSAWVIFAGLGKDFMNEAMDGKARVWGGLLPIDSFRKDAKLLGEIVNHGRKGDFDEMLEAAWKEFQNLATPVKQIRQTIENN